MLSRALVAAALGMPAASRTRRPARAEGPDLQEEGREDRAVRLRPQERGRDPGHGGHRDRDEKRRVRAQVDAVLGQDQQDQGDGEGADHGHHLAPGVDPPPEPAHEVEEAGPGPDLQDHVEGVLGGVEHVDEPGRAEEQAEGGEAPDQHVVRLGRVLLHEATVEVVHEVRGAPVEMGEDGRGVRGDEAAHHEADEAHGKELQHRGIRDVVPEQVGVEVRKGGLDVGELGVHEQRAEADQDPGPGAQHVVGDVEEEHRAQGVLLRLRREHPLGDVAAASGLRARVPDRPPLHRDRHDEDGHRQVPVAGEVGQDVQVVQSSRPLHGPELAHEPGETAHLRRLERRSRPRPPPRSS